MTEKLNDEELAFLHWVLDLAREGRSAELAELIDRGVPVNLTSASGDTLLILATYHGPTTAGRPPSAPPCSGDRPSRPGCSCPTAQTQALAAGQPRRLRRSSATTI